MNLRKIAFPFLLLSVLLSISCLNNDDSVPSPLPFEEQLEIDIEIIDEYLDDNNILAQTHESGIRYVIIVEGDEDGENPTSTSNITFKYKGTFLNGSVFDQSIDPVNFNLSQLIEAFRIGLPLVKEGTTVILYAPSVYCYGSSGTATIPPNSNLIFEVELIGVAN